MLEQFPQGWIKTNREQPEFEVPKYFWLCDESTEDILFVSQETYVYWSFWTHIMIAHIITPSLPRNVNDNTRLKPGDETFTDEYKQLSA